MEECGSSRCLQDRRYFRKELSSWFKKVPYTEGLELVAEYITQEDSGVNFKTLMLPFNDMEPNLEDIKDFSTKDSCWSCDEKSNENADEITEIETRTMENKTPKESQTASDKDIPQYSAEITAYYQQWMSLLLQKQLQSSNGQQSSSVMLSNLATLQQQTPQSSNTKTNCESSPTDNELKIPEVKVKPRNRKDPLPKKNYSDTQLNKAVEEIQSGSIGTRKASKLYDIPRSTLRNKVFKASEMNRSGLKVDTNGHLMTDESSFSRSPSTNGSPSKPIPSLIKRESTPKNGTADSLCALSTTTAFQKQFQELQSKQLLEQQVGVGLFGDLMNNPLSFGYNPFLPQPYAGIAAVGGGFEYMNAYPNPLMMPYMAELVKNLTQRRESQPTSLFETFLPKKPDHPTSPSNSSLKDDEIKIPAYRPNGANAISSDSRPTSSAHSLPSFTPPKLSMTDASSYLSQFPNMLSHTMKDSSRSRKHKMNSLPSEGTNLYSSSPNGKKRPKRGQYRKYDSELLAQAVRAVRRGEMSVHRAGTFYGVPHSTLEYKVKERGLLRKQKLAQENAEKLSNGVLNKQSLNISSNSNDSSMKCESLTARSDDSPLVVDDKTERENTPHDLSKNTFGFGASATELLRKLQERAEEKAASQLKSSNSDTPIFPESSIANLS